MGVTIECTGRAVWTVFDCDRCWTRLRFGAERSGWPDGWIALEGDSLARTSLFGFEDGSVRVFRRRDGFTLPFRRGVELVCPGCLTDDEREEFGAA